MKNENEHCFIKYANDLSQICKPLFEMTPVTYFSTVRVFPDGSYTGVMSDLRWAQYYLQNKYDECALEFYQAYLINQPYVLWSVSSVFEIDEKAKQLYKACVLFDYTNGITLIEKSNKHVDLYYFVSAAQDKIDEFFIYNIDQLKLFVLYFKDMINTNEEIKKYYVKRYFKDNRRYLVNPSIKDDIDLAHILNIKKYYIGPDNHYLTATEMKVLLAYIEGKSMKEIARKYDCSARTAEVHMVNIKNKLNIKNKTDLLTIAHNHLYLKNLLLKLIK